MCLGSVLGECAWGVCLGSVPGECAWGVCLGSVPGQGAWGGCQERFPSVLNDRGFWRDVMIIYAHDVGVREIDLLHDRYIVRFF